MYLIVKNTKIQDSNFIDSDNLAILTAKSIRKHRLR
jgi:hypothetical protein